MAFEIWRGKVGSHWRDIDRGPKFPRTITHFRVNGVAMKFDGIDALPIENGDEVIAVGQRRGTKPIKIFAIYNARSGSCRGAGKIDQFAITLASFATVIVLFLRAIADGSYKIMAAPCTLFLILGSISGYSIYRIYSAQSLLKQELSSLGYDFGDV